MVMEAFDSEEYCKSVNSADLVTPDGMPLVWCLRQMGFKEARRAYGPDLMLHALAAAEMQGLTVGFYGGSDVTIAKIREFVTLRYPNLQLRYAYSPPYRELSPAEEQSIISAIQTAGVAILFIGLGCPKQEFWMARHKGIIDSVMLGVGAAFDFFAGTKPQAPRWMMQLGLEWLFRLTSEPQRLWRRYLINNPRFLFHYAIQMLKAK
jgi:N-acetylglucosaminyldiphosphoundecaprenol N-acetyl-beta-D-mannosaminyltransferase